MKIQRTSLQHKWLYSQKQAPNFIHGYAIYISTLYIPSNRQAIISKRVEFSQNIIFSNKLKHPEMLNMQFISNNLSLNPVISIIPPFTKSKKFAAK
jgi:hypothetical protein